MTALLDWLADKYPTAKRTTLRRMVQQGRVIINGKPARSSKDPVSTNDTVEVRDQPDPHRSRSAPPTTLPFPIVHEDDDVLVIDKPAGLLTNTGPREKRPTALALVRAYVLERSPRARVGLIHRLDRDASGLLVFSKNHAAYESLKTQFFHHTVERVYTAVVRGTPEPPAGRIESRLLELADGRVVTTRQHAKGQRAITDYETLHSSPERSVLRVKLLTGRKHQIRAHLAQRGHPILNDPLYSDEKPAGRLMLVATGLSIDHPGTGRPLSLRVEPPPEVVRVLAEFA